MRKTIFIGAFVTSLLVSGNAMADPHKGDKGYDKRETSGKHDAWRRKSHEDDYDDYDHDHDHDDEYEGVNLRDFDTSRNVASLQVVFPGDDSEVGMGFGYYHFPEEGIGYFANFQIGLEQGEPYYEDLTPYSFSDPIRERSKDPLAINVGITKSITENIGVFGGVGYGAIVGVARMYDPLHILAEDGEYYVPDAEHDESGVNFTIGGNVQLGTAALEVGYNSFTSNIYLGLGWSF